MNFDAIREYCLSLPHVTEGVQWDNDLLFRIGNKMFAVLALDAASPYRMSFKCTPEEFAELTEREGIDPAPYMARNHWVALKSYGALPQAELKRLVKDSYEMIKGKLPKKVLAELDGQTIIGKKGSKKGNIKSAKTNAKGAKKK
jgi:predicted DNA-binding protein (MmcQ/YjbR family)